MSAPGSGQVTPPAAGFPALPPGFSLGVASSAYQVEGALAEDGRGRSIWESFAHLPGAVVDGCDASIAADGYHRLEEDVALVAGLGVGTYRFSVAWPRVVPGGRGPTNQAGLDFYDRLVDRLLEAGVAPTVTLYHHDLPQHLEDDGGWLNPATVEAFAHFAEVVGERLADRVAHWIPVHEPCVVSTLGYGNGTYAPGRRLWFDALWAAHHVLLGHGRAAIALRGAGATSVGCANNHAPVWPASESPADVGAGKLFDSLWNGLFLEPMLLGRYPADLAPLMSDLVGPGDLTTIRQPLDFYGVNYYNPLRVAAAPDDSEAPFQLLDALGHDQTDLGRPIVPDALREWLIILRSRFRAALPPIVITESGCAFNTRPDADGAVPDQQRIDYHHAHLEAVAEAIRRGVDVRGYHVWSLLDGFEWTEGYSQRFGLVHVDRDTMTRTPKASYAWYRAMIAAQPRHAG